MWCHMERSSSAVIIRWAEVMCCQVELDGLRPPCGVAPGPRSAPRRRICELLRETLQVNWVSIADISGSVLKPHKHVLGIRICNHQWRNFWNLGFGGFGGPKGKNRYLDFSEKQSLYLKNAFFRSKSLESFLRLQTLPHRNRRGKMTFWLPRYCNLLYNYFIRKWFWGRYIKRP